jgi:hypothetical protein
VLSDKSAELIHSPAWFKIFLIIVAYLLGNKQNREKAVKAWDYHFGNWGIVKTDKERTK